MASTQREQPTQVSPRSGGPVARAWISVALIPVFLLVSVVVTLVLYALFGYKPENVDAPLWVDLVTALVAIAIFLVPCVAAVFYGRRAHLAGDRGGLIPLGVAALVGLSLTALTVVSALGPF